MKMKIHNKGQVVIPANIRKQFDLDVGDLVEVETDENGIHLYPVRDNLLELKGCIHEEFKKYGFPSEEDITRAMEAGISEE
ncbi:MAG: AbrB/MazE/SpoVT family DNA-binding domain-containing protein [Candidatus Marinimicrobia bacterium]|nr:AbrB/MazE/SpoVT family DNA-binding domain-containing protein [Candidatus Neomarinimicrobiota bacterium]